MKAMILAAGFGTRLEPLTHKRPKALVPVANSPMVDRTIAYLKEHGIKEVVINAHHLSEQFVSHFRHPALFGIPIHIAVEKDILGTGGGIKNVEDFWNDEPFVVINVDIITDIDLRAALRAHTQNRNLATLVLHDYPQFNQVRIDTRGNIKDFYEKAQPGLLAFTGIHILSKPVLDYIPRGTFYSIIDAYRSIIEDGGAVGSYVPAGHYWTDIGSIESYIQANKEMVGGRKVLAGKDSTIHPSATLDGWVVVGPGSKIGENAFVQDSILWEGVEIGRGASVVNCVITEKVAEGSAMENQVV